MRIGKNILFIALFALMIFSCVNAVSAADSLDNNLTGENSNDIVAVGEEISEIDSNDLLSVNDDAVLESEDSESEEIVSAGEGGNNVVITNSTYSDYFDSNGNLVESVSEGSTLDFQGSFIGKYTVKINKRVNVISSTGDALFDAGATYAGNEINSFNILAGADYSNVSGIRLHNVAFYVTDASHVVVDGIHSVADLSGVGRSTGFVVFRNNASYGVLKNSYMEQGGTGSSIVVIGFGAPYVTIENNTIIISGSSGNILGANAYVGEGVSPDHMRIVNNRIISTVEGSTTMLGITLVGSYNVVEGNYLKFKGTGVTNANMQWAPASIPRDPQENYTLKGNSFIGASVTAVTGSVVEDNIIDSTFSVSGADVTASNNTISGAVTIAKAATNTIFTDNHVKNTVTVNSNGNNITGNQIASTGAYAIDLKTTTGNVVNDNTLSSATKMGDDAVKAGANNNVSANKKNAIIEIAASNSWSGYKNNVTVTVINATGTVTIKINNKEYETLPLKDGKVTFEVNASEIDVGLNYVTAIYNGDENISAESKDSTFYGLYNVVFQEVFYNFFDSEGILRDEVPYNDLVFKGSFSKLTSSITINRPVTIYSEGASLSQMAIKVYSDNVVVDGLTLTTTTNSVTSALGNLVHVTGNDVTLSNLKITYKVTRGNYDAVAINVSGSSRAKILNNTIVFSSVISSDSYFANAINLERVSDSLIDNNVITTTLPALYVSNYDSQYYMMGLNTVNPVRMREVEDSVFSKNKIESSINNVANSHPTIQSLFVVGSKNVLFDSNSFKMVDTKSKSGTTIYLYAFNFGYNKNITVSKNNFYVSTTGGTDASGAAYALQGIESEIKVIGNNITAISNGPNLGFYVASMFGESSSLSYIEGNRFDVTGYATTSSEWALISGIEITNGYAYIHDNVIKVTNKAGYVEDAPVHGVSYAQYMYGDRSLDVIGNTMSVQGKYAVGIKEGTQANVTDNVLIAEELFGDAAVALGIVGTVERNMPYAVEILVDNITVGQVAKINVSTNKFAKGNMIIIVDGKVYNKPIVDGSAYLEISDLADGKYTVGVTYDGDDVVSFVENPVAFTVSKIDSDAIITVGDIKILEDVEVNITIDGAVGEVNVIVDGIQKVLPLNNSVATFTIKSIAAGEHYITVIFMGDSTHNLVTNTTKFTVDKVPTQINVDNITVDVGTDVPVYLNFGSDATGKVFIDINGKKSFVYLENGEFNYVFKDLAIDNYTVTLTYEGDKKYMESSKTFNITVNGFNADLKANTSDIKVGQDAVVDIEINKEVTGQTRVTIGDLVIPVTFTDGKASVSIPDLPNGTYEVSVKFLGDAKFLADEKVLTLIVSKEEIPTDINVTVDIPEGTTAPEFTINLPADATGNFTVTVDGTPYTQELVNGSATVKVPEQTPGNHTISTSYSGDKKYDGFTSPNQTFTVPKASIPGGDSVLDPTTPEGSATPSYTIKLPSDATGNLTVTVDGKDTYTQALVNGTATVNVPKLTPGKHDITVTYSGDEKYSSISKNSTVNVAKPVVKLSKNKNINMLYSAGTGYQVLVTVDGKAAAGVKVTFKFNGKKYTRTTNKKGYATYKIPTVKPKKYTITATYSGKTVKNTVKVNSIIKAKNISIKKSKKVTKVKVTLKKVNKKYLKGKTLKLKIKGKTLKAKTNKKGVATFKVKKNVVKSLKVGKKYTYKVTYGKDTATKKLTIKK